MTAVRTVVSTAEAPQAVGPYSQAVRHGDLLFCSGAVPLDPASGALLSSTLAAETAKCLENLEAVCRGAGTELRRAVRMTVYTTEMDGYGEINDAYAAFFDAEPPARVAIGVAALPLGARVEIDAVVAADR